jgi:hypothetical protein
MLKIHLYYQDKMLPVTELPGMLGQTGNAVAARRRHKAQNRQNARRTLAERQKGLLPVSC